MYLEKRSIVLCIILSLVTCGIYGLYWYYVVARDFYNHQTPNRVDMSPALVIVLNIVTCGIYGIFMYYKWGKQTPEIAAMYGRPGEDRSILYLILPLLGLAIVNMALIQNDFNDLAGAGAPPPQGGYTAPGAYPAQGGYTAPGAYQQAPPAYQPAPPPVQPAPPVYQPPAPQNPPVGSPYNPAPTDNESSGNVQ